MGRLEVGKKTGRLRSSGPEGGHWGVPRIFSLPPMHGRQGTVAVSSLEPPTGTDQKTLREAYFTALPEKQEKSGLTTISNISNTASSN